jgi:hypothetical protein
MQIKLAHLWHSNEEICVGDLQKTLWKMACPSQTDRCWITL